MKVPNGIIPFLSRWEGRKLKKYKDTAGLWTIGVGHLILPSENFDNGITEEECDVLLIKDLNRIVAGVFRACPKLMIENENKQIAIISFAFNLGVGRLQASTLRRKVNEQNWEDAALELKKWIRSGGKITRGLVLRREAEAALIK